MGFEKNLEPNGNDRKGKRENEKPGYALPAVWLHETGILSTVAADRASSARERASDSGSGANTRDTKAERHKKALFHVERLYRGAPDQDRA